MRILHLGKYYPPNVGGTEIYTQDLVRHQSQWATVNVIVSNDGPRTREELRDGATVVRISRFGVLASMPVTPTLPRHIRRIDADIVHLHMPNPAAALGYLCSGDKGRLVITHHCDTVGRSNLKRVSDPVVRAVMRRASRIIVTTKTYLDTSAELADFYKKCCVIPLGVDPARFSAVPEAEVKNIKQKYGSRILTCVGRFVPFKGFEYAIRALTCVDATLLLAGNGTSEASLKQLAKDCGVANRVHFLGAVPNDAIPALLKASSVLLFPSTRRTESFGYSQLEAMSAGVPVVNTSINSGVPEVSVDGVTGITVPPMNHLALAAAARKLLDDDNLRSRLGAAGVQRVEADYTLQKMTTETMKVYEETLEHLPLRASIARSAAHTVTPESVRRTLAS